MCRVVVSIPVPLVFDSVEEEALEVRLIGDFGLGDVLEGEPERDNPASRRFEARRMESRASWA